MRDNALEVVSVAANKNVLKRKDSVNYLEGEIKSENTSYGQQAHLLKFWLP